MNKITHVVNCAADFIDNFFGKRGIKYHSLKWKEFQVTTSYLVYLSVIAHGADRRSNERDL